jgi:hypothetical protein
LVGDGAAVDADGDPTSTGYFCNRVIVREEERARETIHHEVTQWIILFFGELLWQSLSHAIDFNSDPSLELTLGITHTLLRQAEPLPFLRIPTALQGAFFTHLEDLTMSHCGLMDIDEVTCCVRLRHLTMTNNRLHHLPADLFQELRCLETLRVDGNFLQRLPIPSGCLAAAENVHTFTSLDAPSAPTAACTDSSSNGMLRSVSLSSFPSDTAPSVTQRDVATGFVWAESLKTLSVAYNELSTDASDAIWNTPKSFAPNLTTLDISFNVTIRSLPGKKIADRAYLECVVLSGLHRLDVASAVQLCKFEQSRMKMAKRLGLLSPSPEVLYPEVPMLKVARFRCALLHPLDMSGLDASFEGQKRVQERRLALDRLVRDALKEEFHAWRSLPKIARCVMAGLFLRKEMRRIYRRNRLIEEIHRHNQQAAQKASANAPKAAASFHTLSHDRAQTIATPRSSEEQMDHSLVSGTVEAQIHRDRYAYSVLMDPNACGTCLPVGFKRRDGVVSDPLVKVLRMGETLEEAVLHGPF